MFEAARVLGAPSPDFGTNEPDLEKPCPDDEGKYPRNPDDWEPPDGWKETPAGEKTGGKHKQWQDEDGSIRRRLAYRGRMPCPALHRFVIRRPCRKDDGGVLTRHLNR